MLDARNDGDRALRTHAMAPAPKAPDSAELRALSRRISIHALEYSLTISPLYGSPP
jgi:hypothetical protein